MDDIDAGASRRERESNQRPADIGGRMRGLADMADPVSGRRARVAAERD
jgi:hypothetical protein